MTRGRDVGIDVECEEADAGPRQPFGDRRIVQRDYDDAASGPFVAYDPTLWQRLALAIRQHGTELAVRIAALDG